MHQISWPQKYINIEMNYLSFSHLVNQIWKIKQHSTAWNRIQLRPLKKAVIRQFRGSAKCDLSQNLLCLWLYTHALLYFAFFHIIFWFHSLMAFIWALTWPYSLKTRFYLFSGSPIFKGLKKYTRMVEKNGTQNFCVSCTLKVYKKKK